MDFIGCFVTFSSFLVACVLAVVLQVIFFSPISPDILEFPPTLIIPVPSNSILQVKSSIYLYHLFSLVKITLITFLLIILRKQKVTKLGEGLLVKPEDVAIDKVGVLYTATRDGWIKRLHKNGSWENWKWINNENLLGITTAAAGGLLVCDVEKVQYSNVKMENFVGLRCIIISGLHSFVQGLLKVTEDGVTVLASHVNGVKIR